jgi:hypothetical protein
MMSGIRMEVVAIKSFGARCFEVLQTPWLTHGCSGCFLLGVESGFDRLPGCFRAPDSGR